MKTNAKIRFHQLGYVLPLFNGYILFSKLINTKHLKQGGARIKLKLEARGILNMFEPIVQSKQSAVTKLIKVLKDHEKLRFEKDLDDHLQLVGIEFATKKVGAKLVMLKDKINKREEGVEPVLDWSLNEIDRSRYFKKQSNSYDCLDVLKT